MFTTYIMIIYLDELVTKYVELAKSDDEDVQENLTIGPKALGKNFNLHPICFKM